MRLVLATRNAHKLRELGADAPHELEPLPDGVELPPETGATFAENALDQGARRGRGHRAARDRRRLRDRGRRARRRARRVVGALRRRGRHRRGEPRQAAARGARRRRPPRGVRLRARVRRARRPRAPCSRAAARARSPPSPAATAASATTRRSCPDDSRTTAGRWPSSPEEKDAISHRGRAARRAAARRTGREARRGGPARPRWRGRAQRWPAPPRPRAVGPTRSAAQGRARRGCRSSRTRSLIVLKLAAASITGSIAIITEAVHSSIDLIASVVAFFSVRKADEPADEDHPYGHAEGREPGRRDRGDADPGRRRGDHLRVGPPARRGPEVESLGVGIAVIALLGGRQPRRCRPTSTEARPDRLAGARGRRRPPAHRRASPRRACSSGLVLVEATGIEAFDPATALRRGRRRSSSRACGSSPLVAGARGRGAAAGGARRVRRAIEDHGAPEVVGFHKLRARRAGSRRYIDLHVQFARARPRARPRDQPRAPGAIRERIRGADVLIHLRSPASAPTGPNPARPSEQVDRGRRAHREQAPRSSRSSRSRAAAGRRSGRCRRSPATRFGRGARRYSDRDARRAHSASGPRRVSARAVDDARRRPARRRRRRGALLDPRGRPGATADWPVRGSRPWTARRSRRRS